jgi:NodT family efflux transporter outer membrane factor (OMF) lipoprotein
MTTDKKNHDDPSFPPCAHRMGVPLSALALALLLAGCAALAPDERLPDVPLSAAFKEAPAGWTNAAPADGVERGAWWSVFGDPLLDSLAAQVEVSNQNVAAATAAFAQAQALVREQRAALFPTLGLNAGATRSGGGSGNAGSSPTSNSGSSGSRYQLGLSGSWELDLFGRLASGVDAAGARAEASAADLAAARLAAQGELAVNYFSLRSTDAESDLLRASIRAYEESTRITGNRYNAGIAPRSDLLQSQTQLANARADLAGLERTRAQLEHAMAVLLGQAPANFAVAPIAWQPPPIPAVPGVVPSELLQRRPDIAAAQRRVAAANASIGAARAALFPSIGLSGNLGQNASSLGNLFSASAFAWSLGVSLAQTVFDAGARSARIDGARAAWEQSVAQYRQTVLTAFQEVEDQLAAARVLEQQELLRRQASQAADQTEQQVTNRYNAGLVSFTEVVQAQVTALNARRALAQAAAARQNAAVALIRALGGGWRAPT